MRLIIEAAARADIAGAASWYNEQEAGLGVAFLDAVNGRIGQIAKNPHMFSHRRSGVRGAALKRFPYIIFYKLSESYIQIVAVFHQRRNTSALDDRIN